MEQVCQLFVMEHVFSEMVIKLTLYNKVWIQNHQTTNRLLIAENWMLWKARNSFSKKCFTRFCGMATAACTKGASPSPPFANKKSMFCRRPSPWEWFTAALFCKKQKSSCSSSAFTRFCTSVWVIHTRPVFVKSLSCPFYCWRSSFVCRADAGEMDFFFWPTRSRRRCTWRQHLYLGASIQNIWEHSSKIYLVHSIYKKCKFHIVFSYASSSTLYPCQWVGK